jgi:hypothetical protein
MTKREPKGAAREATPLVFVDALEAGRARLVLDDETFTVPARLLPAGAREGSWLRWSARVVPAPPSAAAALRKKLARDDPGGPIKL